MRTPSQKLNRHGWRLKSAVRDWCAYAHRPGAIAIRRPALFRLCTAVQTPVTGVMFRSVCFRTPVRKFVLIQTALRLFSYTNFRPQPQAKNKTAINGG